MANTFLSETSAGIGTSPTTVLTCPSSTQTTVIGLSVSNRATSQINVDVVLDATGRTSGAEDSVYIVKGAPVPVGSSLVVVGGDQKLVMEPGDIVTVTSDIDSSADVILSHLDIS